MELYPNEIAFLNYLDGLPQANNLPEYWKYSYGVDSEKSAKKFIDLGLIEYKKDLKHALIRLSVDELKTILKNNSLKISGKKEQLAERILSNIDIDIIDKNLKEKNFYFITDAGRDLLDKNQICILNIKKSYNFDDTEIKNALALPDNYSTHDRLWNIFVERNNKFSSQKKWCWYRSNIFNMGELLYSESKYELALNYYVSTFIIDLSGMQDNNYIQELEYIHFPPSLIKDIKNLLKLSETSVENLERIIELDIPSKCLPFEYYNKENTYKILYDCLNGIEFNYNKYPHNNPVSNNSNYIYHDCSNSDQSSSNLEAAKILKNLEQYANTVNKTYLPDIFFKNYKKLIEEIEQLMFLESSCKFSGKLPSKNLSEILDKKEQTIKEFLDRYYNSLYKMIKSESNRDSIANMFFKSLNKYNNDMSEANIKYYEELHNNIKTMTVDDIKANVAKNSIIPYQIIDDFTVKIHKRTYNTKQLKLITNFSFIFAILFFILSYFVWFTFFISIFLFWISHLYHKICKAIK